MTDETTNILKQIKNELLKYNAEMDALKEKINTIILILNKEVITEKDAEALILLFTELSRKSGSLNVGLTRLEEQAEPILEQLRIAQQKKAA